MGSAAAEQASSEPWALPSARAPARPRAIRRRGGLDPRIAGKATGMSERESNRKEEEAAQAEHGEDQEPKQSEEESSDSWDTKEHSESPGPFGTGDG